RAHPVSASFSRYSRQVVLREVGVHGQQLLRDSSALVIGLGGLGSVASLYRAEDVGRPKTEAARERLAALNAEVQVEAFEGRLEPARLAQMVAGADVV